MGLQRTFVFVALCGLVAATGCSSAQTTTSEPGSESDGQVRSGATDEVVAQIEHQLAADDPSRGLKGARILAEGELTTDQRAELKEVVDAFARQRFETLSEDSRQKALAVLIELDAQDAPIFGTVFAKAAESEEYVESARYLLESYVEQDLEFLSSYILDLYEVLRAHQSPGSLLYNDMAEAMIEAPQESWTPVLVEKLGAPILHPQMAKTDAQKTEYAKSFADQMFWHVVAIEALGKLRSEPGIPALFKVMLDPTKSGLVPTALLALVEIGPPAQTFAAEALRGNKPSLEEYAQARAKALGLNPEHSTVFDASAAVLGMGGLPSSEAILLEALARDTTPHETAVLARELPKVTDSARGKEAFRNAFESLDPQDMLSPRAPDTTQSMLADAATQFFDADFVPWLARQAVALQRAAARPDGDKARLTQFSILYAAFQLVSPDQLDELKSLTRNLKLPPTSAPMLAIAQQCGDQVACYLQQLVADENQEGPRQYGAIKAAYMVGMLGTESDKQDLLRALPRVRNPAVHFAALQAIEHLSPRGDLKAAAMLREQVKALRSQRSDENVKRVTPILGVVGRLESRARYGSFGDDAPAPPSE